MNNQELHRLIELYFNGDTTLAQESALRQALAQPWATGEEADEARAVIGVSIAQRVQSRHKKHYASWRAAAAIAVFAAAGAALTILPERNTTNATYTAYCLGHTTHDRNDVLAIMRDDLGAMAEAASNVNISIKDDFAAINNAFNTLN